MKNKKLLFAGIVLIVFGFAGFNIYSYLEEQEKIEVEAQRIAVLEEQKQREIENARRVKREEPSD
jgi:hypothetical protein